jgi:glyoxylase-like metal-dependent hydrolase (beta-lactamase superfamily II)
MKRTSLLLAVSLIAAACSSGGVQPPTQGAIVSKAVQAAGGADRLAAVKTVSAKGTMKQWEPEQSASAGGEMRFANESTFEMVADFGTGAARTDWVKKFAYPAPRTFTFTEIVTPDAGYVAGIDSNGRTKQSLDSNPPAHAMSGLRLAATQRELMRGSPLFLLDMAKGADRVTVVPDISVGGVAYPAVNYRVGPHAFTVLFDRGTGLPARIRTLDYDNIWGDVTYDLVLSDWQTVDGVRVPMTRMYELNGRPVTEIKLTEVKVNAPIAADRLAIPAAFKTGAAKPATGAVPYQWVLRRQFIGVYLDSDSPSYDTKGSPGLRLNEVAPGVQHVVGGSHNSLVVEMSDHLIVFDAPVSDAQSKWVLDALKAKYPNKPVKYLVLTHHHMDHAGGLRAYAAQGAILVVGQGTAAHYKKVLAAPATRNPDLAVRDLSKTEIIEVMDKRVLSDGRREVHAYVIAPNPHADGLLIGFVPDAQLGFVTDIWTPGPPLPDKLNPLMASLVAGVKKAGISPQKFAGGHGGVADYAPLAALEGK